MAFQLELPVLLAPFPVGGKGEKREKGSLKGRLIVWVWVCTVGCGGGRGGEEGEQWGEGWTYSAEGMDCWLWTLTTRDTIIAKKKGREGGEAAQKALARDSNTLLA